MWRFFLWVLLLASLAQAKPIGKAAPRIPFLAGECFWGEICQEGRKLSVAGADWLANGQVREDGKVELIWVQIRDGRVALSVYSVEGQGWEGLWGWAENTKLEDGKILGEPLWRDRFRVKPPPLN